MEKTRFSVFLAFRNYTSITIITTITFITITNTSMTIIIGKARVVCERRFFFCKRQISANPKP